MAYIFLKDKNRGVYLRTAFLHTTSLAEQLVLLFELVMWIAIHDEEFIKLARVTANARGVTIPLNRVESFWSTVSIDSSIIFRLARLRDDYAHNGSYAVNPQVCEIVREKYLYRVLALCKYTEVLLDFTLPYT